MHVWAVADDLDPALLVSNTFRLERPPRSGRFAEFPEIDRAEWMRLLEARRKILRGQAVLLARLEEALAGNSTARGRT